MAIGSDIVIPVTQIQTVSSRIHFCPSAPHARLISTSSNQAYGIAYIITIVVIGPLFIFAAFFIISVKNLSEFVFAFSTPYIIEHEFMIYPDCSQIYTYRRISHRYSDEFGTGNKGNLASFIQGGQTFLITGLFLMHIR